MAANPKQIYEFGTFRLDLTDRLLTQKGKPIALTPKAFEVLVCLVERRGHLVEKDELMNAVWADSIVEEGNLSRTIWMLRQALGDDRNGHGIIHTVPKHGYRFVADVKERFADVAGDEVSSDYYGKDDACGETEYLSNRSSRGPVGVLLVPAPPRRRFWLWTTAVSSLIGIAIIVIQFGFSTTRSSSPISFERMNLTRLTQTGRVHSPTISPDGQYVAYVSIDNRLTLQQIATGSTQQIVPHRSDVQYWDWKFAPDNSNFYFVAAERSTDIGILYQTSTLGGQPRKIIEFVNGGLALSPDGLQIAFKRIDLKKQETSIVVIGIDGTGEHAIASVNSNSDYWSLDWSPDGSTIAYTIRRREPENESWYVAEIPASGGTEQRIGEQHNSQICCARWLPNKSGLLLNAMDPITHQPQIYHLSYPDGSERRVTNDTDHYGYLSVSADGKSIVTQRFDWDRQIWIEPVEGPGLAQQLTTAIGTNFDTVVWSVNNHIVFDWDEKGNYGHNNIWRMEADGSSLRQLTFGASRDFSPTVSPDGQTIVFVSSRSGTKQLWSINIDGGQPTQVTNVPYGITYPRFASDGQTVFFTASVGGEGRLWRASLSGGEPTEVSDAHIGFWAISPEGGRAAYSFLNKETGKTQVRVHALSEDRSDVVLDIAPLSWIVWSKGGTAIYFNSYEDHGLNIWRQEIDSERAKPVTDFTRDGQTLRFSLSPDSKKLVCIRQKHTVDAVLIRFEK